MKQEILDMLLECHEKSKDIIWILDENWKIVGSNMDTSMIFNVTKILNVSWNCWEETQKQVYWKNTEFQCILECNQKYGYRVARLTENKSERKVPFDIGSMSATVHFLVTNVQQLYDYSQKHQLKEIVPSLNIIMSNCWRFYRVFFIEKLLEQLGKRNEEESLSVTSEMEIFKERTEQIFEKNADVDIEFSGNEDTQKCILEERQFFNATMLAAVILCCQDTRHKKKINIQVKYSPTEIEIDFRVRAHSELCEDWQNQPDSFEFGSTEPECLLLDTFCRRHNGYYTKPVTIEKQEKQEVVSCEVHFKPESSGGVMRSKSWMNIFGDFNDVYPIMLSRVCFYSFFREERRK